MSSPRALGGGLAAPAPLEPEAHVRTWADTRAIHTEYAREVERARLERARGEHRLADQRMRSADKMLAVHERHLRAQRGDETAREWIARARREAGLA